MYSEFVITLQSLKYCNGMQLFIHLIYSLITLKQHINTHEMQLKRNGVKAKMCWEEKRGDACAFPIFRKEGTLSDRFTKI